MEKLSSKVGPEKEKSPNPEKGKNQLNFLQLDRPTPKPGHQKRENY